MKVADCGLTCLRTVAQMCDVAKRQPSVHMSNFQRRHKCNVPHEGHSQGKGFEWWKPLLTSCEAIFHYNRKGNR